MRYTTLPRGLAAAAVLTLVLAGCSSSGSGNDAAAPGDSATGASTSADPASSQPGDAQASPSGSASVTATQKPDQPVYYKGQTYDDKTGIFDGMKWQGGMIHGGASQMPKLTISGWMPGMGEFTTCNIDLSSDDDAKFTTSTDEDAMSPSHALLPKAIATTGDKPQAYVTFAATSKASGSKAGEQRLYVQSIDLELCTAGERIDVLGEPLDDPVTADPVFVGATDDTLAISIFGPYTQRQSESKAPNLVGFNVKDSTVAWSLPSPGPKVGYDSFDAAGLFAINLQTTQAAHSSLVSVETGKTLVESSQSDPIVWPDSFVEPTLALGSGKYLYTTGNTPDEASQHLLDGDKPTTIPDIRLGSNAFIAYDAEQKPLVVGMDRTDDFGGNLIAIDESGTPKTIIASGEMWDRKARVVGAADGLVYLESPDSRFTVDLNGEAVGDPIDVEAHPFVPIGQRKLGDQVMTLWEPYAISTHWKDQPAAVTIAPDVLPGVVPSSVTSGGGD